MSMAVERTRELKEEDKHQVVKMLQSLLSGNKLAHGAYQKAATRFGLHRATISKVWKQFNKNDMGSKKKGRVSRRAKYTEEELKVRIASVPQSRRSTIRDLSLATGLSHGMICRTLRSGVLKRKSSRIKPQLTTKSQGDRIQFCRATTDLEDTTDLDDTVFDGMWDVVHLDEK
ncbi:hypothetical protein H310_09494 [Aphanomyces invadans]|uniref:Transposase Tc1-like domain-containing protein n=1 Tax=Aphanomyces invadans TaxID=157072 RepID=A0A024TU97_9STRA|nr:hypothetical protein H310_09494 [Aphanomyces invadans]ETV97598.1 hypothetical protein H310_09494 [Aphanomyces invadans]|eukprot:XP_008873807.1 hypothetical protein H310_09494 [Aphanomyces invadans]